MANNKPQDVPFGSTQIDIDDLVSQDEQEHVVPDEPRRSVRLSTRAASEKSAALRQERPSIEEQREESWEEGLRVTAERALVDREHAPAVIELQDPADTIDDYHMDQHEGQSPLYSTGEEVQRLLSTPTPTEPGLDLGATEAGSHVTQLKKNEVIDLTAEEDIGRDAGDPDVPTEEDSVMIDEPVVPTPKDTRLLTKPGPKVGKARPAVGRDKGAAAPVSGVRSLAPCYAAVEALAKPKLPLLGSSTSRTPPLPPLAAQRRAAVL